MSEQDHLQYFSGRNSISIKDVAHEYLKKLKPSTIPMAKFNFRLSDVSDQDAITNVTNLCIVLKLFLTRWFTGTRLITMWDHMDG